MEGQNLVLVTKYIYILCHNANACLLLIMLISLLIMEKICGIQFQEFFLLSSISFIRPFFILQATIKASIPPHITSEEVKKYYFFRYKTFLNIMHLFQVTDLGSGLCRGPKWQRNGWPYDEGIETFEECFNECKKIESCTAFDLSPTEVREKFRCYLFGHDDVIPATSYSFLVSNCYRMTGRKAIAGKKKDIFLRIWPYHLHS